MRLLCLDVGNTHTHYGLLENGVVLADGQIATASIDDASAGVPAVVAKLGAFDGASFCSVVPAATARLGPVLEKTGKPVFHLRHDNVPGLAIAYPNPAELGQDRLANCLGAQVRFGAPAVVIDMGTAVSFDVLTHRGCEGGVIAPGIGVMAKYLHEKTAQLPELDIADLETTSGIGRSTLEAMKIGCATGFSGMIEAILKGVLAELEKSDVRHPTLILTGGVAGVLPKALLPLMHREPHITLYGLEAAFRCAFGDAK